jgi:hypothetical protein
MCSPGPNYSVPRYIANSCARPILAMKLGWQYKEFTIFEKFSSEKKNSCVIFLAYILSFLFII